MDKPQLLIDLLEFVFDVILAENPDAKGLALLELILSNAAGIDFSKGFDRDQVEELLEAAQYAIGQHPELVTGKPSLADIIADVRSRGDQAVIDLTARFDRLSLTPETLAFTTASLCAIIFERLSFGFEISTPSASKECPASSKTSDACNSALDGMQPMLRHVPP